MKTILSPERRARLVRAQRVIDLAAHAVFEAQSTGLLGRTLGLLRVATAILGETHPDPLARATETLLAQKGRGDIRLTQSGPDRVWEAVPEAPPGAYLGSPSVESLVQQLRLRKKPAYTMLLVGPTGTGKTTLARRVAQQMNPGRPTVRVPGDILKEENAYAFLSRVADVLRPSAIILDDVGWDPGEYGVDPEWNPSLVLALLEGLHARVPVILTIMDDSARIVRRAQNLPQGTFYYAGLRPGRVDVIEPVLPPTLADRKAILAHYGVSNISDDLLKKCNGLPGAYLAELALRLQSGADPERTIRQLRACAPRMTREQDRAGDTLLGFRLRKVEHRLAEVTARVAGLSPPSEAPQDTPPGESGSAVPL